MNLQEYYSDLSRGYLDGADNIKLDYIIKYPEELAESFSSQLSTKQIRSFFDASHVLKTKTDRGATVESVLPDLYLLSSTIVAKVNKGIIPASFAKFYRSNLDVIKTKKDLDCFMKHFEAVYNLLPETEKKAIPKEDNKSKNGNYNNFRRN